MTEAEQRRRARDLERRLRALGIHVRPGMFEPLEDARTTRSATAAILAPKRIRRYYETPITVR